MPSQTALPQGVRQLNLRELLAGCDPIKCCAYNQPLKRPPRDM